MTTGGGRQDTFAKRFTDQHVLVTGGGTGLGRAIAERFAAEGAAVTILGRRADVLAATARSIASSDATIGARVADVTVAGQVRDAVADAVEEFGPVRVVVNNAGIAVESPFLELTEEAWDAVLAANVKGTFLVSQLVARQMATGGGGGVIINNASIDAHGGERRHAAYNASKAALIALTRTMAIELAEHRVRVNAVSPGYVFVEQYQEWASPALLSYLRSSFARVPQQRLLDASEVAAAFAFLASDDASGITGEVVTVDGGLTANLFIQETWPRA